MLLAWLNRCKGNHQKLEYTLLSAWKGYVIAFLGGGAIVWLAQSHYNRAPGSLRDARRLIISQDLEGADALLRDHLQRSPSEEARVLLAEVLAAQGAIQESLEMLNQIRGHSIWAVQARLDQGRLLRRLNRAREAEALWLECLNLDERHYPADLGPDGRGAIVELMKSYVLARRRRDAENLMWYYYNRVAPQDRIRALLTLLKEHTRDSLPGEDVIREMEELLAADPEDDNSRRELGRLYLEFGRENGRELLESCFERNPNSLEYFTTYLWCLTEEGDVSAANDLISRAPRSADTDGEAWHLRGMVLEFQRRWAESARCFRETIRLEPWRHESHAHLTYILRQMGEVKAAKEHDARVKEITALLPRLAMAAKLIEESRQLPGPGQAQVVAEFYEQWGRSKEAIAWYDETLRLDPANEDALSAVKRLGLGEPIGIRGRNREPQNLGVSIYK